MADGVWARLVGQDDAVAVFERAAAGAAHAMTHAWLITGPPGSGRSVAGLAFGAALQCAQGGCGACSACRTALAGAHPDVTVSRTEQLSIGIDEVRELVRKAAMTPTLGGWQVIIIEDADRLTPRAADALLKSIEEPPKRTVWVLCAPSATDVIATIRSRTREVRLGTPSEAAVSSLLVSEGVAPDLAAASARAAQGHIGRARWLATDEQARASRAAILRLPGGLRSVGDCLRAAAQLVADATEEAERKTAALDTTERQHLSDALGLSDRATRSRSATAALAQLTEQQKARAKRTQRDSLDRVLIELTTWYRDILSVQTTPPGAAGPPLINVEFAAEIRAAAAECGAEQTVHHIDALLTARCQLLTNVAPLLAMEALLLSLARR